MPALKKMWASRNLTNGGEFHEQFEDALSQYLGVEHVSLFTNCTVGLIVALRALDLSGEVITTPFSFVATAHSLMWNHLRPVFVDVDEHTLNINPDCIESAISANTVAIMPVHVYGQPCDVEAIDGLAKKHGLKVIYDAAHAFGVKMAHRNLFAYGDVSVLSFHATKVFNTFEGGAVVCRSRHMKEKIDRLKNFGIMNDGTVGALGLNGKMSEFNAALGLAQLNLVEQSIVSRQRMDTAYRKGLADVRSIECYEWRHGCKPNYAYFPIRVRSGYPLTRDQLFEVLLQEGIRARRYFYPLISDSTVYADLPSAHPDALPVAQQVANEILCLPIYPDLSQSDVERIIYIIRQQGSL